jgi:hypothetical protein
MKKAQIITLTVCVIGGVALLAAAWTLFRGVVRFNLAAGALDDAKRQLTGYYQEAVFPSAENVQREKDNTLQVTRWYEELTTALRAGNVTNSERSPSRFVGILERARERLLRDAQAAGTELPKSFAFGFDRYTGTGTLPRPDDVPRLTEQLILVTRVCIILFENRVKELRVVERALFEEGADVAPAAAAAGPGRRPAAGSGGAGAGPVGGLPASGEQPGIIPEGGLYGRYRFAFEFNAKETSLLSILNALASSPVFTVVNVIRGAKEVPVLLPAVAETPVAELAADTVGAGVGDKKQEAPSERLGPNYPVCGLEMEIPMQVRIELDILKFKGDSNESGG